MDACRAQIGSTSVTHTWARNAARAWAQPLPTSPKPHTTAILPAIITSVARLMPSTKDSRQPYKLSNLDLVTESLTLIAGNASVPSLDIWYKRCTPVVVSSVTPLIWAKRVEYQVASSPSLARMLAYKTSSSSLLGLSSTLMSFSACAPKCNSSVASPPSSKIILACSPGHVKISC